MKKILLATFLLIPLFSSAQIVNVERLRVNARQQGWVGTLALKFNFTQNTRQILQGGLVGGIENFNKGSRFIALTNFTVTRANQEDLINRGYIHFRYSYQITKLLVPEAFVQLQYNGIQKIDLRMLSGIGMRLRIVENDTARFFLGTAYMYEYNQFSDSLRTIRRTHRQSNYISFGYAFTKTFIIDQVTFFQPSWVDITDFRLLTETRIQLNITEKLAFRISFSMLYDARPVEGLPNKYFELQNSLAYTF